ncbi:MAG: hypothetical protein HDS66_01075 [Bacteroidales bacterium]|nr:hypothetical protein [Bacteroidales bacterium]
MVDFNLNEGGPVINDDYDCLIQQIDILFDTTPGDLIGDIEYGTDYERHLYDLKLTPDVLREHMLDDLRRLDLLGFTPDVSVYLMQGTERDIAIIDVQLRRGSENYSKQYKIS